MVNIGSYHRDTVSRLISWGHWFTLFNILVALLIAVRYILASPWPETPLGGVYMLISWLGHFGFIGFVTFLLTAFPLSFLIPSPRVLRLSAVCVATAALTLLLVDTQVYKVFKFHINPLVWDILLQQSQSKSELSWSYLFVAFPAFLLLELLLSSYAWRLQFRRRPRGLGSSLAALFVGCFLLTHLTHIWADAKFYAPITAQKSNFPLSYPMTARSFLARHGWLDLEEFRQRAAKQGEPVRQGRLIYPLQPLDVVPPAEKLNLLLVVVQGLRYDMLNNVNMPNLARYASQHLQFLRHVGGDNSSDSSLFSLFYGLPAQYLPDMLAEHHSPLLLDELQRQDYLIGAFASQGLDSEIYQHAIFSGLRQPVKPGVATSDARTLANWQQWLAAQDRNRAWFTYLALNGPSSMTTPDDFQGPFQPELEQVNPFAGFSEANAAKLINRYRNAVFYTDQLLGGLLDNLNDLGLADNTVVVITSDHGQEFNDSGHNNWGFGSNYSPYQVQVPLVLAWPGMAPATSTRQTSHLDLAPSLMQNLLGVRSYPSVYSSGQSLLAPQPRNWVLAGDQQHFVIYGEKQITEFNRQGDFRILDRDHYQLQDDAKPDMAMLIQVMNELHRFRKPS